MPTMLASLVAAASSVLAASGASIARQQARPVQLNHDGSVRAATAGTSQRRFIWSPEDGEPLTGITFSYQNSFNSSTESIMFNANAINLFSGMWSPSPLEAPMNGEIPSIKSHKLNYGFRAVVDPLKPAGKTALNGSFSLAPQADVNFTGFAGYAFAMMTLSNGAQVRSIVCLLWNCRPSEYCQWSTVYAAQEIIIESEGALWDDLFSEEYGSMVGNQVCSQLPTYSCGTSSPKLMSVVYLLWN